jgi:catechol 2,3-dioxygenase-like lactoylglutathione lyase family enzyme
MPADRITANLPSRDFSATAAFYARLGFAPSYRGAGWMILHSGPLEVEFFPFPDLDPFKSSFSACLRVDDIDSLRRDWGRLGLPEDPKAIPRITGIWKDPGVPRMFAVLDEDGSLLRVLENGG